MQLQRFDCPIEFYARASSYLLQQEANHNLLLRLCDTLIRDPNRYPQRPYLALVETDSLVQAIAMITPSYPLVLSQIQDVRAIELIAQDLVAAQSSLVGVNAPIAVSQAFAAIWQQLTGHAARLKMALRAHQLTAVQPVCSPPGYLRPATATDQAQLRAWHQAFTLEALGTVPQSQEQWLASQLSRGTAYFWQAEQPTALICGYPYSDRGATLNLVYTPPEFRRRGYASASVAALSQQLLARGAQFCTLFTDLANPTSNKIYRAIGYQPLSDWHHYDFGASNAGVTSG